MEYADLGIIRARRTVQQEKHQTLESGIYVKDDLIRFHTVELLDGKLSIQLPEYFEKNESRDGKPEISIGISP